MARRYCYKEVLPFTAMVAVECGNVGVNILFKAATSKGMSYYIFITYSYAIATLVLLPLPFIFYSRAVLPPLKFHLISRICLLGLIGFSAQICTYKGIEYSSPTLASAVGNLSPAFTFILAILFRMEKVALRSSTTQAKIMGTIVSISGALVVVLYKGPKVFSSSPLTSSSSSSSSVLLQWPPESSAQSNWVIGGVLIAVAYLLYSFWYIIQTQVMEIYPQELTVAFFYNLCATFIATPVSLIAESKLSSWRLTQSIAVVTVLYSGVFSSFSSSVHIWGLHLKGPVYVVIFKPLSIAIAAFMSAIFLGDTLHLGSVIGAIILSMGFYAVIWGKANEEERIDDDTALGSLGRLSNDKAPLLQSHKVEDI
ncbi:WAT1-related protein At4g15540-like [Durio zibethinus]|uniref:WAT1-related protein n=1 Tax=Durio zibethinus TaxID=66656 RepID=A0A6P5ZHR3_DURZI|nr:WAT1-related protein At4g15540-like [Durio zibethinus]